MTSLWHSTRAASVAGLIVATSWAGCGPSPPHVQPAMIKSRAAQAESPWFDDVTSNSGLDFTYQNGAEANRYTLLESLGGGVGLIDYDRDGWLDIVLPGGGGFDREGKQIHGRPTHLFRNLGNWKFEDVTARTGLDQPDFYSHGCAVADYDRDGWSDLLVTGFDRLALFHNEDDGNGGRRFSEVSEAAGLRDWLWSTSASVGRS